MCLTLLRNLGLDETIVQALRKSYGENLEGIQIEKDDKDLRLLVKRIDSSDKSPQVVTIHRFFEKNASKPAEETDEGSTTGRYSCQDTLDILPEDGLSKGNVRINGYEMRLGDTSFHLLKYLAQEIKRSPAGWAYIQDMVKEKVIPSAHYYHFARLRSSIGGYLLEKNPKDFIESNGRKRYRVSTDPRNVSVPEEARK